MKRRLADVPTLVPRVAVVSALNNPVSPRQALVVTINGHERDQ